MAESSGSMTKAQLIPTAYDGGLEVHINNTILPKDGIGMDEEESFRYRYSIKNTSVGHWAVFSDSSCRLSKSCDCFIYSGMPSGRPDGFVEDTTWPTAEEAAEFLEKWRERETARCVEAGMRKWGEPKPKVRKE